MEAGRELDALVAEKVFGRRAFHPAQSSLGYLHIQETGSELPHYSTDISAAWEVVAKLGERYAVKLDLLLPMTEEPVWRKRWYATAYGEPLTENACDVYADGATAPHAICLAALQAVGHPVAVSP